jgi:hypothetical protein
MERYFGMDIFMADENVRVAVTLSKYVYRRLKLWSLIHGKAPASYAAQIISARIEANFDTINRQIEDYAKSQGKTVEEVLATVDNESSE